MGYRYWVNRNNEVIKATSAIVSAVGIVFAVVGIWVSIVSLQIESSTLEVNKQLAQAKTFFEIQRFGIELVQNTLADPSFLHFIHRGIENLPEEDRLVVVQKFSILLAAYNIIIYQRKLENIADTEWNLFRSEFCSKMRSKGADFYFKLITIENLNYDEIFKNLTLNCRTSGSNSVSDSQTRS